MRIVYNMCCIASHTDAKTDRLTHLCNALLWLEVPSHQNQNTLVSTQKKNNPHIQKEISIKYHLSIQNYTGVFYKSEESFLITS